MKYLTAIAAILFFSLQLTAQDDAISRYFDQYVDDENFTVVYVSPKMFEILGKLDLSGMEDEEAQMAMEVVKDLRGVRVLTTEHEPGKYYKEANNRINTSEYATLVKVRDKGENVRLMIKDQGDIINEMLVLVGGDDEFVLVSLIGNIDLKKISKLAKAVDIKGLEHLEKVDEKDKN